MWQLEVLGSLEMQSNKPKHQRLLAKGSAAFRLIYLVIFLTTNNAQLNTGTTDTVGFLWLPDQHLLACCDGCESAAKTKLCRSFWCQSIPMGPMAENW